MNQVLLRMNEAANAIAVSRSHFERLVARGEISTVRVGRSRRVPADELQRWVNERVAEQAQQDPSSWTQLPLPGDFSDASEAENR
jgi:excisionase family DNA binding protein